MQNEASAHHELILGLEITTYPCVVSRRSSRQIGIRGIDMFESRKTSRIV
jgi:hypothetical protein